MLVASSSETLEDSGARLLVDAMDPGRRRVCKVEYMMIEAYSVEYGKEDCTFGYPYTQRC